MKRITLLTLPAAACLGIVSCDSLNQPLSGGDSSNPLDAPGGTITAANTDPYGPAFTPGTFLQTVSPSTSFFKNFPKDDDQPSKILADYTDVKVISSKDSYVKVEVIDTGEVGYVPSVMLGEKRSPEDTPTSLPPTDVPPLVPGDAAPDPEVPGLDTPAGGNPPAPAAPAAPPADAPAVAPEPEIPGIEPPKVVDPQTPAE